MPWIIVREVATDGLSIVSIPEGTRFPADPAYRWGGFFASNCEAQAALDRKDPELPSQLYGKPRGMNGTPGPEAVKELLRIGGGR